MRMRRVILTGSTALTVVLLSGATWASEPHATAKASAGKVADKQTAEAASTLPTARTMAELQALSERIQQKAAEVVRAWSDKPAAGSPAQGKPAATVKKPAPAAVTPAPAPRVRLVWRASVAWPAALHEEPARPAPSAAQPEAAQPHP